MKDLFGIIFHLIKTSLIWVGAIIWAIIEIIYNILKYIVKAATGFAKEKKLKEKAFDMAQNVMESGRAITQTAYQAGRETVKKAKESAKEKEKISTVPQQAEQKTVGRQPLTKQHKWVAIIIGVIIIGGIYNASTKKDSRSTSTTYENTAPAAPVRIDPNTFDLQHSSVDGVPATMLDDGGTVVTPSIHHQDYSSSTSNGRRCEHCLGNGRCHTCNGHYLEYRGYVGAPQTKCPNCSDGSCQYCNGTGWR